MTVKIISYIKSRLFGDRHKILSFMNFVLHVSFMFSDILK